MSLFPFVTQDDIDIQSQSENQIPCEFDYDFINNELKENLVYGKEAIKIWIYKALLTKRYKHLIYSWDYGHEIDHLIGKNYNHEYIASEMRRFIEEVLSINENILTIEDFECTFSGKTLSCTFVAKTKYGEVAIDELSNIRRDY